MPDLSSTPDPGQVKKTVDDKRRENIVLANKQRTAIKVMKRAIKAGVLDDLALIRGDLPEYEHIVSRWRVERLVLACRNIGPKRAYQIFEAMHLDPQVRVRDLTFERRLTVARLVNESRDILS